MLPHDRRLLFPGLLVAVLLACSASTANAQARTCEAALASAEEEYAKQAYDLTLTWADYCLRRLDPTPDERRRTYRLQALAHLGKDQPEEARAALTNLLALVPDYTADADEDPPDYLALVRDMQGGEVVPDTTRGGGEEDYVEVEVFYGTDRKPSGMAQPTTYYGGERGSFEVGACRVSIPKGHQLGQLESPTWWKLEFSADPAKHIVLLDVAPLPKSQFQSRIQASVNASGEKALLVFVHGYNVTFENAARRTAQMAYDLGFDGVPVFYSWPANGGVLDYPADEADVRWTVPHLQAFLEDLATESGAQKIHVIAHSMGNRAVTDALRFIAMKHEEPLFNQVVLTAPDVDADVFVRDIVPAIRPIAERLTLYASSNDQALKASKTLHQYPRAGESGAHLVVAEGLDSIDVSQIDTDLLGHSYFAETRALLTDLYLLLKHGHPPSQRNLLEHKRSMLSFWTLR